MKRSDISTLKGILTTVLSFTDWALEVEGKVKAMEGPGAPKSPGETLAVPNPEDILNDLKALSYTWEDEITYSMGELCGLAYEQILRIMSVYLAARDLVRYLKAPGDRERLEELVTTVSQRCEAIHEHAPRLKELYLGAQPLWDLIK